VCFPPPPPSPPLPHTLPPPPLHAVVVHTAPPHTPQDGATATLKACERLALSTNQIDRMTSLAGMESLKILSLSRNLIKKIEKLEDVAATLEELWLSYNQISSLDGLASCSALTTLYLSNNKISDWAEVEKLAALPALNDLLLVGNPIFDSQPDMATARAMVVKRVPQISKLDNVMVKPEERERAKTL
jgi:dynein light chain 1